MSNSNIDVCPAECWTFQGHDTSPCTLESGHDGPHLTGWPGNKFEQAEADEVAQWQRQPEILESLRLVCEVAELEVSE